MQFLHAMFCFAFCVFVFWNYFIILFSLTRLFVSWKTCSLPEGWIANVFWCVHGYSIVSTWLRTYFAWNVFFNANLFFFFSLWIVPVLTVAYFSLFYSSAYKSKTSLPFRNWSMLLLRTLSNSSSHQNWYKTFRWFFPFYIITLFSYHRFSWDSWLFEKL